MTLEDREPINDDDDPLHFNWDAYEDSGYNHATFQLLDELQARGTEIIVTTWDLPDWLVADSRKDTKRFIPYDRYPEAIETIVAWLPVARDQYGIEPMYPSTNQMWALISA